MMQTIRLSDDHRKLLEDAVIAKLVHSLYNYALGDIKKVSKGENVIASFILCSCFIEQMANFRYPKNESHRKKFESFVKEYLPAYDPGNLRHDLRNLLVHNYSIGAVYALVQGHPELHLNPNEGTIFINLEGFIIDLQIAFDKLQTQFREEGKIRRNALEAMQNTNIISGTEFTFDLDTNKIISERPI